MSLSISNDDARFSNEEPFIQIGCIVAMIFVYEDTVFASSAANPDNVNERPSTIQCPRPKTIDYKYKCTHMREKTIARNKNSRVEDIRRHCVHEC